MSITQTYGAAAIAALTLLAAGCSATAFIEPVDGIGPHQVSEWPIINGSAPDSPEHDATVSLHQLTNGGSQVYISPFCSGTLISSEVILTAAHCLDTAKGGKNFKTMAPGALAIYLGDDPAADILDHLYLVTETLIHPGYDRQALEDDIALVRLAAFPTEAAPIPYLPPAEGFTTNDIGSTVNFAGFGDDENGNSGIKLQVDGTLGGLGCSVPGCFDAGVPATQVSYNQYNSGPCFGDSGGPMFVYRGSGTYVGALTSYGDNTCSVYGVSTRADAFAGWIDAFIGLPNVDPTADAGGPYSGNAGLAATLDGSNSFDSDGSIVDYAWDFGDGTTGSGASPSHTWGFEGTYTITLTVTDDEGATDVDSTSIAVGPALPNQAPTADAGGPYSAIEGNAAILNGSSSSDSDGSIVDYAWDFGDGSTGSGSTTSHTWAAAGTYTITLTVTDDDGATDVDSTSITVTAQPACDATGTLSGSNRNDYVNVGAQATGTNLTGDLSWTGGGNVDLYLQRLKSNGRWSSVASSDNGGTAPESISYTVPSSYGGVDFRWRLRRRAGTADYCLAL